jgi:5-methylcytosine-specific restriction endonuclease McrA
MSFPKPEPHAKVKARHLRSYAKDRAACVAAVWKRANHRCEECRMWVLKPSETDNPISVGHVHEIIPRSRGGSATDPDNCRLLCVRHHAEAHHLRVGH